MIFRNILASLILIFIPYVSHSDESPSIQEIAPLTQIPGLGVSFKIPNEDGWMLFDPDGKGSFISKSGQTKIESYIISLDSYKQPIPDKESEFNQLYDTLKSREIEDPRYRLLTIEEKPRDSSSKFAINFYYLVEDHQPIEKPTDQSYMLIETMGFFASHPNIPDNLIRVAYSYRYIKGHEDSNFKNKARWVLSNVEFSRQ